MDNFISQQLIDVILTNVNQQVTRGADPTLQSAIQKKLFSQQEIKIYLGLQFLFKVFQFPENRLQWTSDDFMKGGLEILMLEGRYNFIQKNLFTDKQKLISELDVIRSSWFKLYKQGSQLYLWRYNNYYHLFETKSYCLIQIFIADREEQIIQFLSQWNNKNQIIYLSFNIEIQTIEALATNKIYVVCYTNSYTKDIKGMMITENLFVFPRLNDKASLESLEETYQTDLLETKYQIDENYQFLTKQQSLDLKNQIFTNALMGEIYNNYCLSKDESNIKIGEFLLRFAKTLIGEKYNQLESDRQWLIKKSLTKYQNGQTQTERETYGLHQSYSLEQYHQPFMEDPNKAKFCLVCMKYETVTKSSYQCKSCWVEIGQKVTLCLTPCFHLFHKCPRVFLPSDNNQIKKRENEPYFNNLNVTDLRVEREYKKHNDYRFSDVYLQRNQIYLLKNERSISRDPSLDFVAATKRESKQQSKMSIKTSTQRYPADQFVSADINLQMKNGYRRTNILVDQGCDRVIEDALNSSALSSNFLTKKQPTPNTNEFNTRPIQYPVISDQVFEVGSKALQFSNAMTTQHTKRLIRENSRFYYKKRQQLPNTIQTQQEIGKQMQEEQQRLEREKQLKLNSQMDRESISMNNSTQQHSPFQVYLQKPQL